MHCHLRLPTLPVVLGFNYEDRLHSHTKFHRNQALRRVIIDDVGLAHFSGPLPHHPVKNVSHNVFYKTKAILMKFDTQFTE